MSEPTPLPETPREQALREFHQNFRMQDHSFQQVVAVLLLTLGAGIPAMELAGFGHLFPNLGLQNWLAISGIAGAVAGTIYYPDMRYFYGGILPGALAGPSVLLGTFFYARGREEVWNVELALVGMVAALPAAGLYYLIMRALVMRDVRDG